MPSLGRAFALSAALSSALWCSVARAASWNSTVEIAGNDFFDSFVWFNDTDPTNGLVTYQNVDAAKAANLSYVASDGSFVMGVSTQTEAPEGRPSVRITSKQSYADGVYVLNVSHVPIGCSSWPAFWTVTEDIDAWPIGGEIDILENGNDEFAGNLVSAHVNSSTCFFGSTVPDAYGQVAYSNCSAYTDQNTGCRVEMINGPSPTWGTELNNAGGGIFAMERSFGTEGKGVRVWFFPARNASALPADLQAGSTSVNTDDWGKPYAHLPIGKCFNEFAKHSIVFDITLCGDWASNTYNRSGCAATYQSCSSQVAYNGSSYNETYWKVNNLRVFTSGGGKANAANSPQKSSKSSGYSLQRSLAAIAAACGLVAAVQLLF
ncbi:hypothetical protein ACQY0O_000517 [Thecaphora frezii]